MQEKKSVVKKWKSGQGYWLEFRRFLIRKFNIRNQTYQSKIYRRFLRDNALHHIDYRSYPKPTIGEILNIIEELGI